MSTMKIALFSLLIAVAGCDDKQADPVGGLVPNADPANAEPAPQEGGTAPAEDPKAAADGTKHDPPIALEEVPDGHWYCDMGTSHYTQKTEGDGKCPLCGMALKHMDHAKMGHGDHHHGGDHHDGGDHHHSGDHHH